MFRQEPNELREIRKFGGYGRQKALRCGTSAKIFAAVEKLVRAQSKLLQAYKFRLPPGSSTLVFFFFFMTTILQ
jgi:hypothetical protein